MRLAVDTIVAWMRTREGKEAMLKAVAKMDKQKRGINEEAL